MTFTVALSGKGGTGKTTISALLINLLRNPDGEPLLAVDADPNSTLNGALGVDVKMSIGDAREMLLRNKDQLSPTQTKEEYFTYLFRSAVEECDGFDLLVMGRAEGPGCYCFVNNLLRKMIDSFSNRYPLTIIDSEAGLEHFSRRTTRDVDILLIVTDPTVNGALTAKRIRILCQELNIKMHQVHLIANRVPPHLAGSVKDIERISGLECITAIPEDPLIQEYGLSGRPLTELPETSPALRGVKGLVAKLQIPVLEKGRITA